MELLSPDSLLTALRQRPSRVELYWDRADLDARSALYWERARRNLLAILDRATAEGCPYRLTEVEDPLGICLRLERQDLPALPAPHASPV